jgi:acetyl-CoA carboxylase biotin carboxylase subunit
MGRTAVMGAQRIGYSSLGTMEFLYEEDLGRFYFMEMNTRLQVEHPVTEMVTGLDLVKLQIRIAAGEELPLKQEEVVIRGHSIECRINAENPSQGFRPSPGSVGEFFLSGGPGVRIDSHVIPGATISPHYDSMVAKLIVHGSDRAEALARMERALAECLVEGIDTTIPFHLMLLSDPTFLNGTADTRFVERRAAEAEKEAAEAKAEAEGRAAEAKAAETKTAETVAGRAAEAKPES